MDYAVANAAMRSPTPIDNHQKTGEVTMQVVNIQPPDKPDQHDGRWFVVQDQRELETVALKLLNERRTMQQDAGGLKDFIEHITDEQDGDLAVSMLTRLYDVRMYTPETV